MMVTCSNLFATALFSSTVSGNLIILGAIRFRNFITFLHILCNVDSARLNLPATSLSTLLFPANLKKYDLLNFLCF